MTQLRGTSSVPPVDSVLLARALRRKAREVAGGTAYGAIYAIQAGTDGPIKIGRTDNPAQRLKTLQTANHEELIGLAAWSDWLGSEADMHREYEHLRIRGEWFRPAPELVDMVTALGGYFCDWDLD